MLKRALVLVLLLLGAASVASALTESEKAAEANQRPTREESKLRKKECALPFRSKEWQQITKDVGAKVVKLPQIRVVTNLRFVYHGASKDTYSVESFEDLPHGGIASKDICGIVKITPKRNPKHKGDVLLASGVWLRPGVDLEKVYPDAAKVIKRKKILTTFPAGKFALISGKNRNVSDWLEGSGNSWAASQPTAADWLGIESKTVIGIRK